MTGREVIWGEAGQVQNKTLCFEYAVYEYFVANMNANMCSDNLKIPPAHVEQQNNKALMLPCLVSLRLLTLHDLRLD